MRKNIITVAIDSPAAAGAGSQAKLIAKEYNLFYQSFLGHHDMPPLDEEKKKKSQ